MDTTSFLVLKPADPPAACGEAAAALPPLRLSPR